MVSFLCFSKVIELSFHREEAVSNFRPAVAAASDLKPMDIVWCEIISYFRNSQ